MDAVYGSADAGDEVLDENFPEPDRDVYLNR
jgi:hypothetical protein